MKKNLLKNLALSIILTMVAIPSNAIEITTSDKSKSTAPIFKFNVESHLPLNLSVNGKIEFSHAYSNLVGDLKIAENERWSLMGNAEANLAYNWVLVDAKTILGDFKPTISPYIGYKQFGTQYAYGGLNLGKLEPTVGISTIGGINYGLRASTSLPLGFYLFGDVGMTSMMNNGLWYSFKPDESGSFSSNNMLLPRAQAGASFNLLNLFTLKVAYNYYGLPDIRSNGNAVSDKANIQSIDIGATLLFFSI